MVKRQHRIPIKSAQQPVRNKMGGLGQGVVLQVKFEPGLAGQFHLRQQQKPFVGDDVSHLPEIKSIANAQAAFLPAATIQTISADQLIYQAT